MRLGKLIWILSALLWANNNHSSELALTPAQHQYLSDKGRIAYCVDPDWHPFESIEQGMHIGMSRDYINLLESMIGTSFFLVPTRSWSQTLKYLAERRCDMIPMLNHTEERAQFARFTDVYFRDPNVMVVRLEHKHSINNYEDLTASHKVAVIKGYMQDEFLRKHFPHINTLPVNSELDGLIQVSRGKADAIAGSLLAMTYHIQNLGLSNLHIASDLPQRDELRMAVHKDDPELQRILDTALAHIEHQQHAEIYRHWNPISISRKTDYSLAWQVGTLFLLILGVMVERYWSVRLLNHRLAESNQQLRQAQSQLEIKNEHLTHLSRYDSLTGALNRRAMRELAEDELQRWKRQPSIISLLVLDLDKFKLINDNFGHTIGDQVLKNFTQRVNHCLRETDRLARWGGEEFLIICHHQHKDDATILIDRIMTAIRAAPDNNLPEYRCSIGFAYYQAGDSFERWFERADEALYQAKSAGGDQYCESSQNT
ncbi:diguanylate cyclase domain-containing protein [Simiduia agarivorans]|uniref:diguanylate cyclase n=1 Tax=Simiduia agarivorans (strain DSM 21679 / JCM 13881 / BCRC 17597 / SA1) TaxID=1117647 RepID=K4KGK0_SIMAS|nr:diguanylate cyclase [Simiduia agarivorans]AFU97325.1 diguanylate cyclase [Simiduia agarivorans SA1 = DSM 21679]